MSQKASAATPSLALVRQIERATGGSWVEVCFDAPCGREADMLNNAVAGGRFEQAAKLHSFILEDCSEIR
jgi:hypothetical protein